MIIDLSNVNALVTGATRGIGRAATEALISSGASVAVHFNRESQAAAEIATQGDGCVPLQANLTDPDAAERLWRDAVAALGRIDVLVNNAAIAQESPFDAPHETWVADWRRTLDINLVSAAVLSRSAITHFQQHGGGRIIHIASRAAFRGDTPEYVAYAASKGGMVALSRSIARAFGKDGVASFVIAPGFTRTDMAQDFIDRYGEDIALKDIALPRLTEPGDIAPIVVLLASGLADHATGTSIDVNAGSYVR